MGLKAPVFPPNCSWQRTTWISQYFKSTTADSKDKNSFLAHLDEHPELMSSFDKRMSQLKRKELANPLEKGLGDGGVFRKTGIPSTRLPILIQSKTAGMGKGNLSHRALQNESKVDIHKKMEHREEGLTKDRQGSLSKETVLRSERRPLEQFQVIGGYWEASLRSYLMNQKLMGKDGGRSGKLFQNSDSVDYPSTHVPVLLPPPFRGTNKLTKYGKPQDPTRLPVGIVEKLIPFYSRPPTSTPPGSGDLMKNLN